MRYAPVTVTMLRAAFADGEQVLVGYDAIAACLDRIGWRSRGGLPASPRAVRLWARTRDFPIVYVTSSPRRAWTTNFLILAWLAAGAGGLAFEPAPRRRPLRGRAGPLHGPARDERERA